MPKTYSDEERNQIITKLKREANILMLEKGVKKTTVDELVKRVGIPKGTFYLFYPSKEMLLYDVTQDFHEEVDAYIEAGVKRTLMEKGKLLTPDVDLSDCVEEFTDVILGAMEITFTSCLKVVLEPEAMQLILSKLPEDVLAKHLQEDSNIGGGAIKAVAQAKGLDVTALTGSFMAIIFGGMYKREIGEKNWRESIRYLIKGLVMQLVL
ncbi:MAG: TetR/AcrR family transcriptional regulator [Clostridiales bacterium]|nr:TetR/AcrR family transcriptional regulator [Clostridiales bacterium]